jgi:hypothetical protein
VRVCVCLWGEKNGRRWRQKACKSIAGRVPLLPLACWPPPLGPLRRADVPRRGRRRTMGPRECLSALTRTRHTAACASFLPPPTTRKRACHRGGAAACTALALEPTFGARVPAPSPQYTHATLHARPLDALSPTQETHQIGAVPTGQTARTGAAPLLVQSHARAQLVLLIGAPAGPATPIVSKQCAPTCRSLPCPCPSSRRRLRRR